MFKSLIPVILVILLFVVLANSLRFTAGLKAKSAISGKLQGKGLTNHKISQNHPTILDKADRIQKVIAMSGLASRRAAENMILDGRVSLNGKIVTTLGTKMNSKHDSLTVDGKRVSLPDTRHVHWIMLHKPKSLLTTMKDEQNRETVLSIIPQASDLRLVPVGGMDRDDTGLLLLTNEINWIHRLTHPSFSHFNQYEITVAGVLDEKALKEINTNATAATKGSPTTIEIINVEPRQSQYRLSVWLDQRSPRQLEEIVENLGCSIISRKRVVFCGVKLRDLSRGKWRELTAGEVATLKSSVAQKSVGEENRKSSKGAVIDMSVKVPPQKGMVKTTCLPAKYKNRVHVTNNMRRSTVQHAAQ